MSKIKQGVRSLKNGIQICGEFGFSSLMKRVRNKNYHKRPDLETIRTIHLVSDEELAKQRERNFNNGVKFSIITPLYNTPENFLIELIESLESQTYSDWELCLADGSDEEHRYIRQICEEWALKDSRIAYHILEENKGISENTNECIKLAAGDYYGLLDHDDLLHPSALYEVMAVIEEQGADFIYTDEVKFSGDIREISDPNAFNLKPGFGKDDLRSHNFICHFTVFNKELLKDEKEFYRKDFDGSQDHDMVLRLTEKAEHIVHIPKVLYYWRVHSNSVSMDLGTKLYAVDAAIHAVSEQLAREHEPGTVASNLPFQTIYKVTYELKSRPLVSVILHNSSDHEEMKRAMERLTAQTKYHPVEIVYSHSSDLVIQPREGVSFVNCGISDSQAPGSKWNKAIEKAAGEYIVLLDVKCSPINEQWLEEMLMHAERSGVCAVGPKIYYRDDTIAYAGLSLDRNKKNKLRLLCEHDTRADIGYEALLCHVRNTTSAIAACMMFSKAVWEQAGGFSEKARGYEDIDFCMRGIKQGKRNIWTCFAEMRYEGKQVLPEKSALEAQGFEQLWESQFEAECCYHPYWEILRIV